MRGLLFAALGVLALAVPAHGGNCHSFRRHVYPNHYVKAVQFVQPYYLVGQQLRDDARDQKLIQQALEANDAKWQQKFQEAFRIQGSGTFTFNADGSVTGGAAGGGEAVANYPDGAGALLARKCFSCHSGETAKGDLDLSKNVTSRRIASEIFVRSFSDDAAIRMPPDGSLTDDERQILFRLSESLMKSIPKDAQ